MVTFLDLREADPRRLNDAAEEWVRMSESLKALESKVVRDLIRPMRQAQWKGDSAEIAYQTFDRLDDEFELTARQARNVATVLRFAHTEFRKFKQLLDAVIQEANSYGFQIDERRGEVRDPENYVAITSQPGGQERYAELLRKARELNARLQKIVSDCHQMDLQISQALAAFQPYEPGRMGAREWHDSIFDARAALRLVGAPPVTPEPDWTPHRNRSWWDGLTDDQRTLYLSAHPDVVSSLDGLSAETRHEASMTMLRERLWSAPLSESGTARLEDLLVRLEASEHGNQAERLYLLSLSNSGDGLGIVSVGNPDTARHLGVAFVPGITTTLEDMGHQIDRASTLRRTADALTPGEGDVAVIAWLGYDTPGVPDAILPGSANVAAPALDRFVDGQVEAQQAAGNSTAHRTVIGHSYGSTAVGLAASTGDGLRGVHDIIVAGSPGMRVSSVHDFIGIDAQHVWSGRGDADRLVPIGGQPFHGQPGLLPPSWGTAPHEPEFGANRFTVDPGTDHSSYWNPGSLSLNNQAHILVGQYRDVGLVHGSHPQQ